MTSGLITGGAGFVGSHLAEALLERGWRVEVLDDLSTGSIENISHLKGHPHFTYTLDTVMNRPLMLELVDRADVVFHLAAAVGVRMVVERPVHTIETNIKATELVLELAAKKHKPVLLTSTSEVYGRLDKPQFNEEDDLVLGSTSRSRWCYAASKIIDEFLAKAYFKERGLPTVIVRLFNTIGPRQTGQYGMVVPRFIRKALAGEGGGRGQRDDRARPARPGIRGSLQHRAYEGHLDLRAGRADQEADRQRVGDPAYSL
jgi:UDP-glucose 4-epimerase